MANPDLRTFVTDYERAFPSQVWHIREEVAPAYVTTAWALELERQRLSPVVIFERVAGHAMPVIANVFASRERIAWILGTTVDRLLERWSALARTPIRPVRVAGGPAQERIAIADAVDLRGLPILTHFGGDAGPYVTAGIAISNDPDTGVRNLTYARLQLKGRDRFGVSFHSRGHHWDYLARYERRGRNMPMAVAIGAHPAMLIGAATRTAIEVDEYDICGALLGQPVELLAARTIDVDVPASAEIVLEGEVVAGAREPEGPFGEFTGYSTDRSTRNVFVVSAITSRTSPLYLDVTPGASAEHLYLGRTSKEATVLGKLREVYPSVRGLHYPKSGTHFHCYVSMEKQLEGQPRQVGLLLLGLDSYVKLCVVVDADIDPTDEEQVLWALATRVQASRDVAIIRDGLTNQLDPSSRDGVSDKMIIDATDRSGHSRARIPAEVELAVRDQIAERLAASGDALTRSRR